MCHNARSGGGSLRIIRSEEARLSEASAGATSVIVAGTSSMAMHRSAAANRILSSIVLQCHLERVGRRGLSCYDAGACRRNELSLAVESLGLRGRAVGTESGQPDGRRGDPRGAVFSSVAWRRATLSQSATSSALASACALNSCDMGTLRGKPLALLLCKRRHSGH